MNEAQGQLPLTTRSIPLLEHPDHKLTALLEKLCSKQEIPLSTIVALVDAHIQCAGDPTRHALYQRFDEIFDSIE